MARTAEVKRDARIGEAEARAEAHIKEAIAEEQRMAARFLNDTDIAKAQRDFELKRAAYDLEVQTKKAEADMAYELQAAKTKQRIKEEQMQVKVIERTQEIAVQEQEIMRREKELDATVRCPAEAEKFRLEKLAEANKLRTVMEAEAEAESVRDFYFYSLHYNLYSNSPSCRLKFAAKLKLLPLQPRLRLRPSKWPRRPMLGVNIAKLPWWRCFWIHCQR